MRKQNSLNRNFELVLVYLPPSVNLVPFKSLLIFDYGHSKIPNIPVTPHEWLKIKIISDYILTRVLRVRAYCLALCASLCWDQQFPPSRTPRTLLYKPEHPEVLFGYTVLCNELFLHSLRRQEPYKITQKRVFERSNNLETISVKSSISD